MKYVYTFGGGTAEGRSEMKDLLGGKGANLAEMASIGLPVPPGFTISTQACRTYLQTGSISAELDREIQLGIEFLEFQSGRTFGNGTPPLLLSVRSGAPFSMPGMMDTILDLGLNDSIVEAMSVTNPLFIWDAYRRLIEMFGDVVCGINKNRLSIAIEKAMKACNTSNPMELDQHVLKNIVQDNLKIFEEETGTGFPQDPHQQLKSAIEAVFKSWNNERAHIYRQIHNLDNDIGTAVNIQSMVYGNLDNQSGTGVGFTRNPATGQATVYGEFLPEAQGEDIVAGIRTPGQLQGNQSNDITLESWSPKLFGELKQYFERLEQHFRDIQDIEFTIESGKLYVLQTRAGKRTMTAAIRSAVDMVNEGLIDQKTALMRINPDGLEQLLHPKIRSPEELTSVTRGIAASPGAASGRIAFNFSQVERLIADGSSVILVRNETSAEDIKAMNIADGILTALGGATSHAAVVARGMGKSCVTGARELKVDEENSTLVVNNQSLTYGDWLTIDGSDGSVYSGQVALEEGEIDASAQTLLKWADQVRTLGVRANADQPADAAKARGFGAEGIGLCRTEHMFFDADRIVLMRKLIFARSKEERGAILANLESIQIHDFVDIFCAMDQLPVTIRLLDPPLHEFLPKSPAELEQLAVQLDISVQACRERADELSEINPMLGLRGCRLGIKYPDIYEMQVRAICKAVIEAEAQNVSVNPEIMIPLVVDASELKWLRRNLTPIISSVLADRLRGPEIPIGTMIELPRAAIMAADIALSADFFSFGTNDLTQTTWGVSRDDSGDFMDTYLGRSVIDVDPFKQIDQNGVGFLIQHAVKEGRAARAGLKTGICGEQGGDPASILFCHEAGLDYVSASPYRIHTARLAAAQAALGKS